MMQRDRASEALGMTVLTSEPGHSVVTMTVREDMLNGHAIAHGGLVFALADTAFAIACNDSDEVTVAAPGGRPGRLALRQPGADGPPWGREVLKR